MEIVPKARNHKNRVPVDLDLTQLGPGLSPRLGLGRVLIPGLEDSLDPWMQSLTHIFMMITGQ